MSYSDLLIPTVADIMNHLMALLMKNINSSVPVFQLELFVEFMTTTRIRVDQSFMANTSSCMRNRNWFEAVSIAVNKFIMLQLLTIISYVWEVQIVTKIRRQHSFEVFLGFHT